MQHPSQDTTIHISPAEWRWVIIVASGLVLLAFVPFLWVAFSGVPGSEWQFMGVLNNYRDGATYLAKMEQGVEGLWLVTFRHTPEAHNPALIQVIYPALGQVARLVRIPPIALFHAARVGASLIMYLALYHLAASIWTRVRTRRIFFALVAVGSGLGWFFAPLTGQAAFPDLTIPEIFPFYSSLVNVHFPLALACLALLVSLLIVAFRPGATGDPGMNNGGLAVSLLTLALTILYPQALVPLIGAVGIYVAFHWGQHRRVTARELRWLLAVALPAVPLAAYYVAIIMYNPAIAEWNSQNVTLAPSPIIFALGLGLPLVMAVPGIYRAVRKFEQDGDQLMLIWLIAIIVAIYLPTNVQRRFSVGLMLPVVYFATRALDSFWFNYINRRWRYRLLVVVIPVITFSYGLVLLGNLRVTAGPFLPRDYAAVFQYLEFRATPSDVVLASEDVAIWVPGWTGARVVYGHPFETLDAAEKEREVIDWYSGEAADCSALIERYSVRYVILGPQELSLGEPTCLNSLTQVFRYGAVAVYSP